MSNIAAKQDSYSIKKDVKKLFIETLNYRVAGGGVMTEYLSSPVSTRDLAVSRPAAARRTAGTTVAPRSTGGSTGGGGSY